MKFDTDLNMSDYVSVVEIIANGFFNENNEYVPHVGKMVALGVFCDFCMSDSTFQDVENPDLDVIFSNEEIMNAFSNSLRNDPDIALTFGAAYKDALNIVEYRKNSVARLVELAVDKFTEFVTPDNLAKLFEASDRLTSISEADKKNVISFAEMITG